RSRAAIQGELDADLFHQRHADRGRSAIRSIREGVDPSGRQILRQARGAGAETTTAGFDRGIVQFSKLRLTGFKSFVDPTDLVIEPGLTGIVGPNGCGKSNLVEALRWAMGETSAKRLRGGEMDDVIFGGTGTRPARNIAEVALTIDNSARDAPFAFNDREEIEVA